MNVYCCLVCGKFFHGKDHSTEAFRHALQPGGKEGDQHNLFIGATGPNFGKVISLPDDEEVEDPSLHDIKYNFDPVYDSSLVERLSNETIVGRSLEGAEFITGIVGLNNLKNTAFINVVV